MSTVNNNVGAIIFKCCSDCFYLLSQVHCNVFLPQICKQEISFSLSAILTLNLNLTGNPQ